MMTMAVGKPHLLWLGVLLAFAATAWHIHAINFEMAQNKSDLRYLWAGMRLVLARQNPYTDEGTRALQIAYYGRPLTAADAVNRVPYVYPATAVIALAPLAALPWAQARLCFLLTMPLLTALTVLLWVRVAGLTIPLGRIVPLALLTVASWPCMWALRLQQPTLIVAALVAAACFLLKRQNPVAAGVLLAMATFKPQLVCLLVAWLLLWAFGQRAWRFVASFSVSMAAILIAAEWLEPGWIGLWRAAIASFARYQKDPALELIFGHGVGKFATVALGIGACTALWRLRKCDSRHPAFGYAIALALATMAAVLPTMLPMIYNQVLLVPGCLVVLCASPQGYYTGLLRRTSLALVLWGFVATGITVIGESFTGMTNVWAVFPSQNLLLPIMITATLGALAFQLAPAGEAGHAPFTSPASSPAHTKEPRHMAGAL